MKGEGMNDQGQRRKEQTAMTEASKAQNATAPTVGASLEPNSEASNPKEIASKMKSKAPPQNLQSRGLGWAFWSSLSEMLAWWGVFIWALWRYLSQFTHQGNNLGESAQIENTSNIGAMAQTGNSLSWLMLIVALRIVIGIVAIEYQVLGNRKSEMGHVPEEVAK